MDVIFSALMFLNKLLGLDKHTSRSAAGVIYPTFVGLNHSDQEFDNTGGSVELALAGPELSQEIFINPAQDILGFGFFISQVEGEQVNKFTQLGLVQLGAGVIFGEDPLKVLIL